MPPAVDFAISPPVSGPSSVVGLTSVALGTYTEITKITAPTSAVAGEPVSIVATVKNLYTTNIYIAVTGVYDTAELHFTPEYTIVAPGSTHTFMVSFIMPNRDIRVWASSYYWAEPEWYQDDQDYVDIALAVGWVKLATRTITIQPIAWQKLATRTITVAPEIAPPVGWGKLATRTITLTPVEIPPEYELVFSHEYPLGKTYVGKASEGTSTFSVPLPDQLFPNAFVVDRIVSAFEDKVEEQGERMLDLKIYIDTTPTWETKFMIKSVCTDHSPFPWAIVIIGILAIILVLAIKNLVTVAKDIDWGEVVPAVFPIAAVIVGGLVIGGIALAAAAKKKEVIQRRT